MHLATHWAQYLQYLAAGTFPPLDGRSPGHRSEVGGVLGDRRHGAERGGRRVGTSPVSRAGSGGSARKTGGV